ARCRGALRCVAWFSPGSLADDVRLHAFGNDLPEALIAIGADDERMRVARCAGREGGEPRRRIVEDRMILNLDVDALARRNVEIVRDGFDVLREARRGRVG